MKSKLIIRRCKNCNDRFQQVRTLQYVCGSKCASEYQKTLKSNKDAKEWRDKKNVMKEGLLTHKDYLKMLQIIFNTFIRERDKNQNCISCDCEMKGRKGDASHYFSVGANANLRFNEDNCHLSCVPCNQFKHGNLIEYGIRLPFRIGYRAFKELEESRNKVVKYSIEEIKEKIKLYKSKIKELKS